MEKVVLVDRNNKKIGLEEKILAHKKGLLHRAFSILIFNSSRELLLQKRASTKYHTPDLWTNTCCSHPLDGESYEEATERKLFQEMGMQCVLEEHFNFIYKSKLNSEGDFSGIIPRKTSIELMKILPKEETEIDLFGE